MPKPNSVSWLTFSRSGPKELCSRKRTAAAELTDEPLVVTLTLRVFDFPPPGAGLVTWTGIDPTWELEALPMAVIMVEVT